MSCPAASAAVRSPIANQRLGTAAAMTLRWSERASPDKRRRLKCCRGWCARRGSRRDIRPVSEWRVGVRTAGRVIWSAAGGDVETVESERRAEVGAGCRFLRFERDPISAATPCLFALPQRSAVGQNEPFPAPRLKCPRR